MTVMVVTGAAGFIGSHMVDRSLDLGYTVRGIDSFTDYYDPVIKRRNLEFARDRAEFSLYELDLSCDDLSEALDGADVIVHLAAQAGVRSSWATGFADYVSGNILGTQRLLEGCVGRPVDRFVYASSSSVYGNAVTYPTMESDLPRPHSPYGVTKLAAEHLCATYASNWEVPTVSLRYFTVYGPRQRPEMAMHRLIEAALGGPPFPMFGEPDKIRDFTYVDDVVAGNFAALAPDVPPGFVANIAGGSSTSMAEVIALVEGLIGGPVALEAHPAAPGDVERTGGSTGRAREVLSWRPGVDLEEGLRRQIAWQQARS